MQHKILLKLVNLLINLNINKLTIVTKLGYIHKYNHSHKS